MYLSDLTWLQAKRALTANTVVMLPLGAAAKEHGPHLRLDNDCVLADYLAERIDQQEELVVAPTVNYHFYPAFAAYAGSTSLRLETARDLVIDVIMSLAAFGPRRFYVLNTGVSTVRALEPAAASLASRGILMHFTRIDRAGSKAVQQVEQQPGGSHADEIETSMMLHIDPARVDMDKAESDYHPGQGTANAARRIRRACIRPSGIYGDATLATIDKGRIVVEATVADLAKDIAESQGMPAVRPSSVAARDRA